MKYFAILKDSLREALDSKVLYVTIGLSALLILFLASISFRPVTMQEEVDHLAGMLNFLFRMQAHNANLSFEVQDFRQVNSATEPWHGDYQFKFVLVFPDQLTAGLMGPQLRPQMREIMREHFWWLDHFEVRDESSSDQRKVQVAVSSRGTKVPDQNSWTHEPSLFFGALPLPWFRMSLTYAVYWVENRLVNTIGGWVAVLLGVVVTASFIPNMLRKGTVDLLLAKPVVRANLLTFKYLGGLTFVFLNALIAVSGVWLVMGLRSGIWPYTFLLSTLVLTFFFAILYAVSVLLGVLTRSTVVSILMTCFVWFVLWIVGLLNDWVHPPSPSPPSGPGAVASRDKSTPADLQPASQFEAPAWLTTTVQFVHSVLPRTGDLGRLTTQMLSEELLSASERHKQQLDREPPFTWVESLTVSGAFIAVMLGLACWRFTTKDY
jgi:ABC-type transport system involved in multi-copper enzyme maturation permease subunit